MSLGSRPLAHQAFRVAAFDEPKLQPGLAKERYLPMLEGIRA